MKLDWSEYENKDGDIVHEAASPYTDEDGTPEFHFRITRVRQDGKTVWINSSDPELIDGLPSQWKTLRKAKSDLQKDCDDIMELCKEEVA